MAQHEFEVWEWSFGVFTETDGCAKWMFFFGLGARTNSVGIAAHAGFGVKRRTPIWPKTFFQFFPRKNYPRAPARKRFFSDFLERVRTRAVNFKPIPRNFPHRPAAREFCFLPRGAKIHTQSVRERFAFPPLRHFCLPRGKDAAFCLFAKPPLKREGFPFPAREWRQQLSVALETVPHAPFGAGYKSKVGFINRKHLHQRPEKIWRESKRRRNRFHFRRFAVMAIEKTRVGDKKVFGAGAAVAISMAAE